MIPEIKKILYATDLTKNSAYAFYFAADLARKHDATIVILHCMGWIPPEIYYEGGFVDLDKVMQKAKQQEAREDVAEIERRLQEFSRKVVSTIGSPDVDFVSKIIVKPAYPVEEILNIADAEECDVIVLGTHGKGWLKQTFVGSTARSVLERTRKPMFIIPLPPEKTDLDWDAADPDLSEELA